jgi:hypothetical protein
MNVQKGGIWRKRGGHIPESFAEKEAHPIQIMVWGGIGQGGYRTLLIRCPVSVTAESYICFLAENRVIAHMNAAFGETGYLFQQDNAPPHGPHRDLLATFMNLLRWPPIEWTSMCFPC